MDDVMTESPWPSQLNQHIAGPPLATEDGPLSLPFLKTLADKRTRKDGNPPKRRGPKPDKKPALTRRQELNRQAQRTHRERKELYVKTLEDEVLRLREVYSSVSHDKDRLAEENRQLRALLAQSGASGSVGGSGVSSTDDTISTPSIGYASSAATSGATLPSSHTSALSPPPVSTCCGASPSLSHSADHPYCYHHQHHHSGQEQGLMATDMETQSDRDPDLDYDQAGIDFVLTLERPCMAHMPWVLEQSSEAGGSQPSGHAMMASCPPAPFSQLGPDTPFGHGHGNTGASAAANGEVCGSAAAHGHQRTWELGNGDLSKLLDLCGRLELDGEITPVMAWGMVLAHPRLAELRAEDFTRLADELRSKVRCYGFGAVMEEFEVRDALENIFSMKSEQGTLY